MNLLTRIDNALEKALQWLWRNRKAVGAALAILVAAYALGGVDEPPAEDPAPSRVVVAAQEEIAGSLLDRLWIDHLPKGHKDSFRMYFFLKRQPVGVHLIFHSATYRTQEFFRHEIKGKKVSLEFPDPGVRAQTKVRFRRVDSDPHFDMKMTLDRDPQTKGVEYSYFRVKQEAVAEVLAGYGVDAAALRASLAAH